MYRKAILVFFAVLVAASAIYALMDRREVTTSSDEAYQAYRNGMELSRKLYTREALQEMERAVELDPRFAMAHMRLAMLYMEFGRKDDYAAAKEKALGSMERVKEFERLQINLSFARAEKETKDIDKYSAELLEKYPNSLEAHEFSAAQCWQERRVEDAIEENLKLLEIDPQYALGYNMLGYLYYRNGEFDKALESIGKYSEVAADQANPHDSHGEILLWLGRYDEALQQFQIADSIKPDLDFVVTHLGQAYLNKGMYRDALGAYFKAKELALSDLRKLEIELMIADAYLMSKENDEAYEIINEIIKDYPHYPSPHFRLGLLYAWQSEIDKALIELGTVRGIGAKNIEENAGDSTYIDMVTTELNILEAEIAAARGEYDKAIKLYQELIPKLDRDSRPIMVYFLGRIYLKAGMPEDAVGAMTGILDENPNYPFILMTLARAYGALGQTDARREVLVRLLDVYKDADEDYVWYRWAQGELQSLDATL